VTSSVAEKVSSSAVPSSICRAKERVLILALTGRR
jgi:hypothetical protein